ncbi:MAG: Z1 domain-containing protein [Bdellovibrionales bacterium]|nr:Z1 domain-containing protein [Bdellovibrionales bacterium]
MNPRLEFIITSIKEKLALGQTLDDAEVALRNVFGKEEVEAAIAQLKSNDPKLAGEAQPVSLSDNQDFLGWYRGPKSNDDSHWNLLKNYLLNKENPWTEEMVKSLDLASSSVVDHLVPPKSQRPLVSKGLVLGYIQSGKTANFSAVIAKAVDEGYKLVVVLSGMHNNLRLQTQARLVEELEKPKPEACMTLTRVDEKGDFDKKQTVTANRALGSKDGFALVVLKKNTHVLRAFNDWISKATAENIKNCPTLIIDDESDQASINTNKPEQNPTAINAKIRDLIGYFDKVSYIGYTATPFGNLLVDGRVEDDIYPRDFLICLEKPPTYFGPEELFGRMGVNGDEEKKPIPVIRLLPEIEDNVVDGKEVIPESLKQAIRSYIISCTLRLLRGQRQFHIMMLVHVSHLISDHTKYFQWVEEYIKELRLEFDKIEVLPDDFTKLMNDDHKLTSRYLGQEVPDIDAKKLFKEFKDFLNRIELILENSQSEDRLSFERDEPLWGIVVGGNTLSRGLTIEGLTTSYFDRTTKQYDTLLQMGRWFGYRKGYVDLTRIYVSEDMKKHFYHLATAEQDLRDTIESMAANGERPIDVAVGIRSFPNLQVTASNKMRTAVKSSLTYSGSKIQFRSINVSESSSAKNRDAIDSLYAALTSGAGKRTTPAFEEWHNCLLYRGVPSENVLQFVESFDLNTSNLRFEKALGVRYITDLNKYQELTDWSVCFMSTRIGPQVTLTDGNPLFLLKRSCLDSTLDGRDYITLKSLVAPADELIDLADVTNLRSKTLTELRKEVLEHDTTDTKIRRNLRPKERGLLLIYPIESSFELDDGSKKTVGKDGVIFGVSLVFPGSSNDTGFRAYVENVTI